MVTAAMKIKTLVAPWKKSYDQTREHIKIRDITLSTKVCLVTVMVFPVVMCGCDSWTMSVKELMLLNCGTVKDS